MDEFAPTDILLIGTQDMGLNFFWEGWKCFCVATNHNPQWIKFVSIAINGNISVNEIASFASLLLRVWYIFCLRSIKYRILDVFVVGPGFFSK